MDIVKYQTDLFKDLFKIDVSNEPDSFKAINDNNFRMHPEIVLMDDDDSQQLLQDDQRSYDEFMLSCCNDNLEGE